MLVPQDCGSHDIQIDVLMFKSCFFWLITCRLAEIECLEGIMSGNSTYKAVAIGKEYVVFESRVFCLVNSRRKKQHQLKEVHTKFFCMFV